MSAKNNNKKRYVQEKILNWYIKNARKLPWREKRRKKKSLYSYYVYVSEFMLQQTTVNTVVPKFEEFIKIWPTIRKLSRAKEIKVLNVWSGLGYYKRAKNLLKSSKIIAKKYNYIIPKDYIDLIQLPGIGEYTAKAIQGIAYNIPVMPIDSNIERFIIRINGLRKIKKNLTKFSENLISSKNSSNFIQALMDYGSAICLPKNPLCHKCVIQKKCVAFEKKITNLIPEKKINKNINKIKFTRAYLIINEFNEILVRRRPDTGMLQSMVEIPNDLWVENKKDLVKDNLLKTYNFKLYKINKSIIYSFSHFDLSIVTYFAKIKKKSIKNYKWIRLNKINSSGLPTVMKKIIKLYKN